MQMLIICNIIHSDYEGYLRFPTGGRRRMMAKAKRELIIKCLIKIR